MYGKKDMLYSWVRTYNNSLTVNEDYSNENIDNEREADFKAKAIVSLLLGENLIGDDFIGIENLLNSGDTSIRFIRECSPQELLHHLRALSDEKGIKNIAANLDANRIFDLYAEKKQENSLDTNNYNNTTYNNNRSFSSPEQNNNYQNQNNYNANINSNNYQYVRGVNYNNLQDNQGMDREQDLVEMCGNSLDCNIHGVRVVIIPKENGEFQVNNCGDMYERRMKVKFNYGRDSQWVNTTTLTKEEFRAFIEEYREEIFGTDYEYQNSYMKEVGLEVNNDREFSI